VKVASSTTSTKPRPTMVTIFLRLALVAIRGADLRQ
jgi:hypothetical protein